jgi:hypothetical protein
MQLFEHHAVIDEIKIPSNELIELWKSFPDECNMPWNEYKKYVSGERQKTQRYNPRVEGGGLRALYTPLHEGKQITEYPVVKEIVDSFNWIVEPDHHDITFMTYRSGFKFPVHYDTHLEYNIMFPLLPKDEMEPINFYEGNDKHNPGEKIYTYNYSQEHPTVFNGKVLHDVDEVKDFRMIFRIKITNESYQDMIERYKQGEFIA